jgi:hypothetical protein
MAGAVVEAPGATRQPGSFRCPAPGTRATYGGATHIFRGSDPDDPAICVREVNGTERRHLFNLLPLPMREERPARQALAALWPLEPGRSASFQHSVAAANNDTFVQRETLRVERAETVLLAGRQRDVVVISRAIEAQWWAGHETHWYEPASGLFLKRESTAIRGTFRPSSSEARAVRLPASFQVAEPR